MRVKKPKQYPKSEQLRTRREQMVQIGKKRWLSHDEALDIAREQWRQVVAWVNHWEKRSKKRSKG